MHQSHALFTIAKLLVCLVTIIITYNFPRPLLTARMLLERPAISRSDTRAVHSIMPTLSVSRITHSLITITSASKSSAQLCINALDSNTDGITEHTYTNTLSDRTICHQSINPLSRHSLVNRCQHTSKQNATNKKAYHWSISWSLCFIHFYTQLVPCLTLHTYNTSNILSNEAW